jgi:RNA polymerase sigma-70 factor (ECF subfamily)
MIAMTWAVDTEEHFLAFHTATARDAFRYASRLTGGDRAQAEELVQDAYLSLLRSARAGAVAEVGAGWVITAVRHRFLDTLRAAGREERRLRLAWVRPVDPPDPPDGIDGSVLDGVALSARERAALVLRYVDDLPVLEVASALGTSVRATESLLARAKAKVRSEVRDA